MKATPSVFRQALLLKPFEKAQLIDILLSSLDNPDQDIDRLWADEAEKRIDAYEKGTLKAIDLENILKKYQNERK